MVELGESISKALRSITVLARSKAYLLYCTPILHRQTRGLLKVPILLGCLVTVRNLKGGIFVFQDSMPLEGIPMF